MSPSAGVVRLGRRCDRMASFSARSIPQPMAQFVIARGVLENIRSQFLDILIGFEDTLS